MSLNRETGRINRTQHKLRTEQMTPSAESLPFRHTAYFEMDSLKAGKHGRLWIDPEALSYTEQEARENLEPCDYFWAIRVRHGYIVDTLDMPFELTEGYDRRVPHHPGRTYRDDLWLPVLHVVENEVERAELESVMFNQYNIAIGRVALLTPDRHED